MMPADTFVGDSPKTTRRLAAGKGSSLKRIVSMMLKAAMLAPMASPSTRRQRPQSRGSGPGLGAQCGRRRAATSTGPGDHAVHLIGE